MDAGELLAKKKLREVTLTVQVEGDSADLQLRALPRKEYRLLLEAHPGADGKSFDYDTFPPALIAASVVEPEFTLEQATELWEEWEDGDASRLFLACFDLNEVGLGVGFTTPGSDSTVGSGKN